MLKRLLRFNVFSSGEGCPPFLKRWTLIPSFITRLFGKDCGVFLHCIVSSDKDMHDHPARFISIGLKGRYIDITTKGRKEFKAPWIRTFRDSYIHKVELFSGEVAWTLVIIFPHTNEFGFFKSGTKTNALQYFKENSCK